MKAPYLLLTVSMLLSVESMFAQDCKSDSVATVRLNFKDKTLTKPDGLQKMKEGDYYRLVIDNLNSNLYKVSLNNADSATSTELEVPGFAMPGLESLTKLITGILSAGGLSVSPAISGPGAEALKSGDPAFSQNMKNLYQHKNNNRLPSDEELARIAITAYQKALKDNLNELKRLQNEVEELYFDYNRFLIKAEVEFPENGKPLYNTSGLSLSTLYDKLNHFRKALNNLENLAGTTYETYVTATKQYENVIKNKEELKGADATLRSATAEFNTSLTKIKERVSAEHTLKYINSIMHAVNNNASCYRSLPMQFTQEQTTLKISIIPRDEKSLLHTYTTTVTFPDRTYRDFWGVSSGFFVGTMHNEAYSVKGMYDAANDTINYTPIDEKPVKAEFGLNVMMRRGWNIGNKTYFHVGIGPAVAISSKIQPRLMGGLGIATGRKHVVLFDVGGSLGYTDVLSEGYRPDETYGTAPAGLMVSRLSTGAYFSISYLFVQ